MDALVHFAVGLSCGLLVLTVVDVGPRRELVLVFASGFWGLVPDGHWVLSGLGVDGPARAWRAVHQSGLADLFWFHRLLDHSETGRTKLETGVALAILLCAVVVYYVGNAWAPE